MFLSMWLQFVVALPWTTAILASYRSYLMEVTSIKTPRVKAGHYIEVESLLSCFNNFCVYSGCVVITYNVTSGQCGLYTNQVVTQEEDGSRLLCININPPDVRGSDGDGSSVVREIKYFVIVPLDTTWKAAYDLCGNNFEGLAQIDSPDKQLLDEEKLREADGISYKKIKLIQKLNNNLF